MYFKTSPPVDLSQKPGALRRLHLYVLRLLGPDVLGEIVTSPRDVVELVSALIIFCIGLAGTGIAATFIWMEG